MKSILLFLAITFCTFARAQNTYTVLIKDKHTGEPLPGAAAAIEGTATGGSANAEGKLQIANIPDGRQVIVFHLVGYELRKDTIIFPLPAGQPEPALILLTPEAEEIEEIIVEATRSNRSIADIPTRVEVLTEEIDEAATMDPSKVAHLLTHSTGIQVQQTSATSNTANVRIQGLDGRYTQILKDGFPLYGGFSGSLSIMQIPPLDLRQVEYIKGSASTLYGGGAIAGLINLLSKEPKHDETIIHLNASHIGAFDVNTYMSRQFEKTGITLLAQRNEHRFFDADKDGYTDMPQLLKYNLHPRLFFYFNERTKMYIGSTFTTETKSGGDKSLLDNDEPDSLHFYREKNDISRITGQWKLDHAINDNSAITARSSVNVFNRSISLDWAPLEPTYRFSGDQLSTFSEISYSHRKKTASLIAGLNFITDEFTEPKRTDIMKRNESSAIAGSFANYTFDIGKRTAIEAGLRADYVMNEKVFVLPRVSMLFRWTEKITSRIGGGMGYRIPTLFNPEAELLGYRSILAIDKERVRSEESYGANADIGFKTSLGENYWLSVNQMLFYNHISKPLILVGKLGMPGVYEFINAPGFTQSYGGETFFKLGFYDFVFFAGYTYTNAFNHFSDSTVEVTLTPQHSLKGDLLYSLTGKWRIGADYEYKSSQLLTSGVRTPSYWTYGVVVEHYIGSFTLFGNVENFTDVRQTDYASLRSGPYRTPQLTEVWAPLDGIVVNVGVKVKM